MAEIVQRRTQMRMDTPKESKAEKEPPSSIPAEVELGRCSYLKNIWKKMPAENKNEMLQIFKLAVPVFVSQLWSFLINCVSVVYCGRVGRTEQAGASLAVAVINLIGLTIGLGLTAACDTLMSQIYGSGNLKLVGVILQKGICIMFLASLLCGAILINTEPILLALGQSTDVARFAQEYVAIFVFALPFVFLYQLLGKYLQNQNIVWPQVAVGAIVNLFNVIGNVILLQYLQKGIGASAWVNLISQFFLAGFLFLYIYIFKVHKPTWDGWSMDCLRDWNVFLGLAMPSVIMMCAEWWLYEIGTFLGGTISEVELDAQASVYQVSSIVFMFPQGFAVAATVRVGNALGAGNIEKAKLATSISIVLTVFFSCIVCTILLLTRNWIGDLFSPDKDVSERIAEVMILYSIVHVAEAVAGVLFGVVRGSGRQKVGAVATVLWYYLYGLPLGWCLMFHFHLGIVGLWIAFLVSASGISIVLVIYFSKLNWEEAMKEALNRAEAKKIPDQEMEVGLQDKGDRREEDFNGQLASDRQLKLRRGLTLVIMVIIVSVGIFISQLLIKPGPVH